ncbi:hypothetical protein QE392_001781 [Microbacterium proteolyticum]|nr:hypothetical protein [Microbacterium proteolyticum]
MAPVSVCHHVSTMGVLSPPMISRYQTHASGVDGLADRTQQPQRRQVELLRNVAADLHERPDGRRSGVEDGDAVLLDQLPPASGMRRVGGSLVQQLRRAVGERSVRHIRVAGDPADVGRAPVHIGLGVHVVDDAVGERRLREIAARGVQDALRFPRRPRGVKDEQRRLGREGPRLVLGGRLRDDVVPPHVPLIGPLDLVPPALDDDHMLDGLLDAGAVAIGEGLVDRGLEGGHLALAPPAVGGDHDLGAGVIDPGAETVGGEAPEDHRVHRSDPGDGEHGCDGLRDHRQVQGDAIALLDTEPGEHVREALDLGRELGVRDVAGVAGLALPAEGDALAVARLHMPIEAVVGDVQFAIGEPFGEGRGSTSPARG